MQLEACAHPFFNELRDPHVRLINGRPLPPLFDFKQEVCPLTLEVNFDIYIIYCRKMQCSGYFTYFQIWCIIFLLFFDETSIDLYSLKLISIDFLDTYPVSYDDIVVWSVSGSCKQADTRPRQKTNESPSYASCTDMMVFEIWSWDLSWLMVKMFAGFRYLNQACLTKGIQSLIVESGGGDLRQLEGRFRLFLFYFVMFSCKLSVCLLALFSFFFKRSPSKRGKILIVYVWL